LPVHVPAEKVPILTGHCMISCFCREVVENSALLGYYTAGSGNFLPTFQDNLSVPYLRVKNPKESLLSQRGVYKGKRVVSEKTQ